MKKIISYLATFVIPLFIGCGVTLYNEKRLHLFPGDAESLSFAASSIISIDSTLLGIMLTVLAIVYSLPNSRIIDQLKKYKAMREIPFACALAFLHGLVLLVWSFYVKYMELTPRIFSYYVGYSACFLVSFSIPIVYLGWIIWLVSAEEETSSEITEPTTSKRSFNLNKIDEKQPE